MWCAGRICSRRPACIACCRRCSACRSHTTIITGWSSTRKGASFPSRRARPGCASCAPAAPRPPTYAAWPDSNPPDVLASGRDYGMRTPKRAKAAKARRRSQRPCKSPRAGATELALASLAHEIRTPLNGILAMSELIAAADLPAREREWAAQVKSAAEHLAHLSTLVVDGVRAEKRGLV